MERCAGASAGQDAAMACERPAGGGRSRHGFRQIIASGPDVRQLLRHPGFDVRIRRAGAVRGGQREVA